MCGICGVFSPAKPLDPPHVESCRRMSRGMLHRGPDEHGLHHEGGVALGHRRLSIIDLSSGQQPMRGADDRLTLVFNGEIYNFRELRRELEAAGYPFRTRSDTEVILAGYAHWGRDVLSRLKGMFAFVIHDARENLIFGARDPLGKKPLYLSVADGVIRFASELTALRAGGSLPDALSPEGLDLYFSLGYIPAPHCIYAGVRKLVAGTAFTFSADGLKEWRYWDCPLDPPAEIPREEALQGLEKLLDQAVERRLISEVPLGAFLSGGVDSNLVVSSMAKVSPEPVKTFTMGFEGRARLTGVRDERDAAAAAAKHYGTDHEEILLDPDDGRLLPGLMTHLGEPLSDPSIIPTYLVCRAARAKVTVALTGDGGDEPFGGYSFRYLPHLMEAKVRRALPAPLLGPLASLLGAAWPPSRGLPRYLRLKTIFQNLSVSPLEAFFHDQSPLARQKERLGPGLERCGSTALDMMKELYERASGLDELSRLLYVDTRLYMCENVLVKADRMSMAASLELRSPLLDQDLVAFAFRLPSSHKISGGECKLLLRRLAEKRVEDGILTQPKTGFSFPVDAYLRGRWKAEFESAVLEGGTSLGNYLEIPRLRGMWAGFLSGDNRYYQFLWTVFVFALWLREVHEKPAVPAGA